MIEIGLIPSSTGLPGGRKTGHSVSDYIDPKGKFLVSCSKLIENGFKIPWFDRHVSLSVEKAVAHVAALESHGIKNDYAEVPAIAIAAKLIGKSALIEPVPSIRSSRTKFECVDCDTRAWADIGTEILCGICSEPLIGKISHSQR